MRKTVNKVQALSVSRLVWCGKALLILSVIFAHCDFSAVENPWLSMLFARVGSMGVPVFLMLSAYYYRPEKYASLWAFLKSRGSTAFPWLLLGSACYLWSNLRMGNVIGLLPFLRFLLGHGSFLYFMTVLLLLQILFYFLKNVNRKPLTAVCIVISLVSTELAAFSVTDAALAEIGITNYLNIFNWAGFFAIGFLLQRKSDGEILALIRKYSGWAALIWCVLFAAGYFLEGGQYGYFSILGPFMEAASAVVIMRLALCLCAWNFPVLLGKYSFPMYLVHINLVPVADKFLGGSIPGEMIAPFCVYALTFLLIFCACFVLKKLKLARFAKYLLGVRAE